MPAIHGIEEDASTSRDKDVGNIDFNRLRMSHFLRMRTLLLGSSGQKSFCSSAVVLLP